MLLTGEPGVGKSRLLGELERAIAGDSHRRLVCRCVPESQASALAELAHRTAAIGKAVEDKSPDKAKAKQWQTLSQEMAKRGAEFAEAVKGKKLAEVRAAGNQLNMSCTNCHSVFRD